jgi:dUTP pyrophosphatase
MKIRVQKLHPSASLPKFATDGAACFDLQTIEPGEVGVLHAKQFRTGLAFEIPAGHVMLIFSRSGHGFKHGMRLVNCVGVVDSDFRGEVQVKLRNDSPTPFGFEPGDRIAQAMIVPVPVVELEFAEALSTTERGTAGFGSTGNSSI